MSKLLTGVLLLSLSSCASISRRKNEASAPAEKPTVAVSKKNGEVFGPFQGPYAPPGGIENLQPLPGPGAQADLIANPDQVVLVFGRGLTQGYAYVGVLRALAELKVPVHAIYATEVGALAAALYYTQPNPNRIDWALLHFDEKNLKKTEGKLSFVSMASPEADLSEKLRDVFGPRRLESLADRLHITLEDAKTGETLEAKSGELWRAVRGALSGANGFAPVEFEGRAVRSSGRKISEEYRIARQAEKYPVIVVSAGNEPGELFHKLVEEQHATLISIPLPGIDNLDLKKKNQAVFAGKNAVHQAANEILGLVGRKLE